MSTNWINFALEIVFEFTVFFLLVTFLVDLFKKYGLPAFYKQIEKIKEKEQDLKDKAELLKSSKLRIESEIKQQDKCFLDLQKKVKIWKEVKKESKSNQEEENKLLLEKVKNKRYEQENNLSLLKMEERVVPEAVKKAYKNIEEQYSGDRGLELLKELVVTIDPKK